MKVLDSMWFVRCGIVRVQTEYDGIRYYIHGMEFNENSTESADAQYIAEWGSTFPNDAGDVLFGITK